MLPAEYIRLQNCAVEDRYHTYLSGLSWTYRQGETWLITGANGSGKEHFAAALGGEYSFVPKEPGGFFSSAFAGDTASVSLENAAALFAEERRRDQSDYAEGADIGRTARAYVEEALAQPGPALETLPEIALTGIGRILDRGLKFLSTGEIRRVLIARALASKKSLLVLSEPFAGLDAGSRKILFELFNTMATESGRAGPRIIICVDRYADIPGAVTSVLEFSQGTISFCGPRRDYEALLEERKRRAAHKAPDGREGFISAAKETLVHRTAEAGPPQALIAMEGVNVTWGDNRVLRNLTWRVLPGEHWFIRGPNGSGKTTLLELITGDNMQVFSNTVILFGTQRGSGETLWDIRKKLGIVSYRLHLEYRLVGGTSVEDTVVSGFHDSIGLYEPKTDLETIAAKNWLKAAGFAGRETAPFSSLSYGEQRAVLILRAVVKCPPLLILDEPCHALDEDSRRMILELLTIVAQEGGSTMLHVTHDPTEMLPFEKHILELCPEEDPMYRVLTNDF